MKNLPANRHVAIRLTGRLAGDLPRCYRWQHMRLITDGRVFRYWAQRRGQRRLDHANAKLAAEGQQPTQTVYQTELDKLRKQIYVVLNKTTTFEEFSALLMQEHGIAVKESRGRLSYCPPDRTKFITAKKLSKKLEKEQVLTALSQNIQLAAIIQPSSEKKPDKIRKLVDIQAKVAAGKGIGYERWAKKFNLKRWSQTLCLL